MDKLKLIKVFIEARYNRPVFYGDKTRMQNIINKLVNILPIHRYNPQDDSLMLINNELFCNVSIFDSRLVVDMDKPESFDKFLEVSKPVMESVVSEYSIPIFNRFGMRSFQAREAQDIQKANLFIKNKLIRITDEAYSKLGNNYENFTISFNFQTTVPLCNGPYKVNLSINPMHYQFYVIDGANGINDIKDYIVYNSDVFKEGILRSEDIINSFISDAKLINAQNIQNFADVIGV